MSDDDSAKIAGALGGCLGLIVTMIFIFIVLGPGWAFAITIFGGLIWGGAAAMRED